MTTSILTKLLTATANTFTTTYDYEVNWIQGEWAGTTSSGCFSYNNTTSKPTLEAFELTLGGSQPTVVREYPAKRSPLYWDGAGIKMADWLDVPPHFLLRSKPGLFNKGCESYYISFAETASGYLMNVYSSDRYRYLGGGLVTYTKRVVQPTELCSEPAEYQKLGNWLFGFPFSRLQRKKVASDIGA